MLDVLCHECWYRIKLGEVLVKIEDKHKLSIEEIFCEEETIAKVKCESCGYENRIYYVKMTDYFAK